MLILNFPLEPFITHNNYIPFGTLIKTLEHNFTDIAVVFLFYNQYLRLTYITLLEVVIYLTFRVLYFVFVHFKFALDILLYV